MTLRRISRAMADSSGSHQRQQLPQCLEKIAKKKNTHTERNLYPTRCGFSSVSSHCQGSCWLQWPSGESAIGGEAAWGWEVSMKKDMLIMEAPHGAPGLGEGDGGRILGAGRSAEALIQGMFLKNGNLGSTAWCPWGEGPN